jgi:tetratricopeptide (TPR) repeat protein
MKARLVLLALLIGAALWLLLPDLQDRGGLPFPEFATEQARPTTEIEALEADYDVLLEIVADEPRLALSLLDTLAFSESALAGEARRLAQDIRAAELQDNPAYTLTAVGQSFGRLGKWELSAEALQRAVVVDPGYAEAWAYLGEAQQHTGEGGLEALQTARALNPLSLAANLFQALYWQRQGDFAEAARYLRIALQIAPGDANLYAQLGHNAVLAGDVPEARNYYEQAVFVNPEDPEGWKLLAAYSLDNDIYLEEVGLPAARRALVLAPEDPGALVLMGRAADEVSGQRAEAARLFERALAIDAEHLGAHLYLGLLLLTGGEQDAAWVHLVRVQELAPESPEAAFAGGLLDTYY